MSCSTGLLHGCPALAQPNLFGARPAELVDIREGLAWVHEGKPAEAMGKARALLAMAPERMNPNAVLVLEIGNKRGHFEAAFPTLEAIWLETSAGEDQVLLLTREALMA